MAISPSGQKIMNTRNILSLLILCIFLVTCGAFDFKNINVNTDLAALSESQQQLNSHVARDSGARSSAAEHIESFPDFSSVFVNSYPISSYVKYSGLDYTSLFATSISMSDKYAVVGANGYGIFQGLVHVYRPVSAIAWQLMTTISSPATDNANFGISVAVDGDNIIVGANAYNVYSGAAYIYRYSSNKWRLVSTLNSPLGIAQGFGYTVSISGNYAIVGTAVNNAFIYRFRSNRWSLMQALTAPGGTDVHFGYTVSMYGGNVAVGSYGVGGSAGAAYIYSLVSNTWQLTTTFDSVDGYNSYFGFSVALFENRLIVGAPSYRPKTYRPDGFASENNTGHAFIYEKVNGAWELVTALESPIGANSYFGYNVAIHNHTAVVGAYGYPFGNETGAAFAYKRSLFPEVTTSRKLLSEGGMDVKWTRNFTFESPAGSNGQFGYCVAVSKSYAAIGADTYQDLRGAVFFASLVPHASAAPTLSPTVSPTEIWPSSQPTTQPSSEPTSKPSSASDVLSTGVLRSRSKTEFPIGIIAALVLGFLLMLLIVSLILYCCCCPAAIAPIMKKKKKKEEEEDSPFTVHHYRGEKHEENYGPGELIPSRPYDKNAYYGPGQDLSKGTSEEFGDLIPGGDTTESEKIAAERLARKESADDSAMKDAMRASVTTGKYVMAEVVPDHLTEDEARTRARKAIEEARANAEVARIQSLKRAGQDSDMQRTHSSQEIDDARMQARRAIEEARKKSEQTRQVATVTSSEVVLGANDAESSAKARAMEEAKQRARQAIEDAKQRAEKARRLAAEQEERDAQQRREVDARAALELAKAKARRARDEARQREEEEEASRRAAAVEAAAQHQAQQQEEERQRRAREALEYSRVAAAELAEREAQEAEAAKAKISLEEARARIAAEEAQGRNAGKADADELAKQHAADRNKAREDARLKAQEAAKQKHARTQLEKKSSTSTPVTSAADQERQRAAEEVRRAMAMVGEQDVESARVMAELAAAPAEVEEVVVNITNETVSEVNTTNVTNTVVRDGKVVASAANSATVVNERNRSDQASSRLNALDDITSDRL